MFSGETLITFLTASVILGVTPGPDNIFVLTQSAIRGKTAGIFVVMGLCSGLVVHSVAVSLGVAAIFQASLTAFSVLKAVGACYLLFLAWKAFRASGNRLEEATVGEYEPRVLFRRGFFMNITNPKVSIFFLAFLPQFTDPARGPVSLQILLLGGAFILSTVLVFGSIAFWAGTLGEWLRGSARAHSILNKMAGVVLLGLAFKLATTGRE